MKFYQLIEHYLKLSKAEYCNLDIVRITGVVKESEYYKIRNESDFYSLPVINKEIAKENFDRIINRKKISSFHNSSGTTGSGFIYPVSRNFEDHQWAIYWKFRYMYGLTTNTWCAYLIGRNILNPDRKNPPYWIKSYATAQVLFSISHLNENTIVQYLEKMIAEDLHWMHGFPSTLNYMSFLIRENGLGELAKKLNLKIITTSSETLYNYQKTIIEETFGCQVRQLYGLTEGVASIYECEKGSLHVDESFSFVEFMEDPELKDVYRIVGSSYHNEAFPLVRYDTGDTVRLFEHPKQCPCGRKSRTVKEILGRQQDYLYLDDGTKVGGSGFFFKKAVNVKRAQIVQKEKGAAAFNIVRAAGYSNEEEEGIISEIKNKLGNNFRYKINYVDEVKLTENGKLKFVINEIQEKQSEKHSSARRGNKLLIIGQTPPPTGGVSIHVMRLLRQLKEDNIVHRHLSPRNNSLKDYFYFSRGVDTVHLNISNPMAIFLLSVFYRTLGKRIILTVHGELGNRKIIDNILMYSAIVVSAHTLVLNRISLERALRFNRNIKMITAFIPPGGNEYCSLQETRSQELSSYIQKYKMSFCTNAFEAKLDIRRNEIYGISGLINIFSGFSDLCLIISNPTNTYMEYLRKKNIAIPENVKIITFPHSFIDIIQMTDCFLRATTTDGDSVSIREALWLGKAVICSDCVSRPEGCILYKNLDWDDLRDKINRFENRKSEKMMNIQTAYDIIKTIY
ncbi:MAG: hypothetical protein ACM3SM_07090 [Bacteroidota bacterium]